MKSLPIPEAFLDCENKLIFFKYSYYKTVGYTLIAEEVTEEGEIIEDGYLFHSDSILSPMDAAGPLYLKIKRRLGTRYLEQRRTGLDFRFSEAKGHVSSGGLVIDGCFVSFERLNEMIQTYEGHLIEIKIKDLCDE